MHNSFWPTLPIVIPKSPGIALWWDIVFWLFQAVVMTTLLVVLRKWALGVDRLRSGKTSPPKVTPGSGRPLDQ